MGVRIVGRCLVLAVESHAMVLCVCACALPCIP
jgi:hypothetical protein